MHFSLPQLIFLCAEFLAHPGSSREGEAAKVDAALLDAIAGGDARAFETLYDRYKGLVYSLALHILKDPGLAEEIVLDAFNQVWQRAGDYQPERAAVKTWLTRIARNRAIDVLRMRRSRLDSNPALWADGELEALPGDSNPELMIERVDLYRQVLACLRKLPDEQLAALQLAYFEGLSHSQIAERLNQPLGTVKGRIRNAMRTLQKEFTEGF